MKTLTWQKVAAGEYRSECGTWRINKTYSRSGWRVFNTVTKFHGYESTLTKAKDMAAYNHRPARGKPLIEIL